MLVGKQVGKKQKMNILKGVSGALKPVSCINTPQTGLDPLRISDPHPLYMSPL